MQSEQYQTCYFLGKSVAYVQIPMTFSFPFGQYEEKNITGKVATYNLGYKSLKNYVIFLIKILHVAQKQVFFFLILTLKKIQLALKRLDFFLYELKFWTQISQHHIFLTWSNWCQTSTVMLQA